jgi:hypothetical protein
MDLHSSMQDEALAIAEAYKQGNLPAKEQVADWHPGQVYSLLFALPEQIPPEDCASLDEILDFKNKWNNTLQSRFLALCIRSGYKGIMPRVELFVETFGRGISLSRIFRMMIAQDWARPLVRPLFERVRERYHPVVISNLEKMLTKAGL